MVVFNSLMLVCLIWIFWLVNCICNELRLLFIVNGISIKLLVDVMVLLVLSNLENCFFRLVIFKLVWFNNSWYLFRVDWMVNVLMWLVLLIFICIFVILKYCL